MADKEQLKTDGVTFGRNLQKAMKIVGMYASVDHLAADLAAQQTHASLAPLLKQAREFTLGFMNKRLLLNNVLTADNPLASLESEFEKRGVAAVTLEAGVTLGQFKRGLGVLAVAPRALEKSGGLKKLLEQNPLTRMRIVPAVTRSGSQGDTVLVMGSESYLLAQGILEPPVGTQDASLDLIFDSAAAAERSAAPGPGPGGGAGAVLDRVGKSVERALADPEMDLGDSVTTVTRLFEQLTPDYLLASLGPAKQTELRGCTAKEMAADLVEDITIAWVGKRLAGAEGGSSSVPPAALDEMMQALVRGLRATRVAERLLQKLSRFVEEAKLPDEINERIRQEVIWFSLPEADKHARLLSVGGFDEREFRRLVNYVHDRMKEGKAQKALEVANHFFVTVEKAPTEAAVAHLAWAPELLREAAEPENPEFLRSVAGRLCSMLVDENRQQPELHRQVAACLASVAHGASLGEEFDLVQRIASNLQKSLARNASQHAECCQQALEGLLNAAAADRLIERFLERRDDPLSTKTSVGLLRACAGVGSEHACERLAEEPAASNRLRLLRLIEQLGPPAIQAARKRLADDRWYVVRNACYLLGKLADPELASDMRGALRHPEVRVQQAAVTAVIKNQVAERAKLLAEALPHLQAHVLDLSLDELTFLKDPAAVEGLERFIEQKKNSKARGLEKAVKVLAATPSDRAAEALGQVLADRGQAQSVRRAALVALSCCTSPHAHRLMSIFARQDASRDELVGECQSILGTSQP